MFLSEFTVREENNTPLKENFSQIHSFYKQSSLFFSYFHKLIILFLLNWCFNLTFMYTLIPNVTRSSSDAKAMCSSAPLVWPLLITLVRCPPMFS